MLETIENLNLKIEEQKIVSEEQDNKNQLQNTKIHELNQIINTFDDKFNVIDLVDGKVNDLKDRVELESTHFKKRVYFII